MNITPSALLCGAVMFFLPALAAAQDFYGGGIQEVRIDLPYKNWDVKLDSLKKANPDARLSATAYINGTRYDSVGIRYKGNSSYFRTRNETYKKLPINFKTDFKIKSQKMKGGHNTVKLSNAFLDPSFIRDPLAYDIIRKYMPAPLCNFSKVYMNGKYYGLYVNTESIDPLFIKKHFGTNSGHLVKCDPDNWQRVRSQSGCPKGENASLVYLNENTGCYDAFYEVDDVAAWKPLINLIRILNKTPEKIETALDVDQTLWMLAINNTIVNLDSYNGSLSHNYYLWFDSTGVAHPLIWDLNMAFGGWRRDQSFAEMSDDALILYSPLAEAGNSKRPLISKLLANPYYRKVYLAHMKTVVNDQLKSGQWFGRAQSLMRDIDPWVKQDSLKLYSYSDFQNSLDKTMKNGPDNVIGLRQLLDKRADYLLKHPLLTKPAPTLEEPKHSPDANGKIRFSLRTTNAKAAWLYCRKDKAFAFKRLPMYDDGTNGDQTAGDGRYSALVNAADVRHYYFVAEGDDLATVYPERASYEFLEMK
ncbi:MAG TPA: CotH kinase family protein [Saprospiraceae bacterium]|nr:CotH kinase family protein [Saprospiraceae bacterium]HND87250.1 CotH kinase family protein [Saprospiraceae bacterium]